MYAGTSCPRCDPRDGQGEFDFRVGGDDEEIHSDTVRLYGKALFPTDRPSFEIYHHHHHHHYHHHHYHYHYNHYYNLHHRHHDYHIIIQTQLLDWAEVLNKIDAILEESMNKWRSKIVLNIDDSSTLPDTEAINEGTSADFEEDMSAMKDILRFTACLLKVSVNKECYNSAEVRNKQNIRQLVFFY